MSNWIEKKEREREIARAIELGFVNGICIDRVEHETDCSLIEINISTSDIIKIISL